MIKFNVRGGAGDGTRPNTDARPQDNLYLAVNSKWMNDNPVPADEPWISSFYAVDEKVRKHLLQDFDDFAAGKNPLPALRNFAKAVAIYKLAKNAQKRDEDGAAPIKDDLAFLMGLSSLADVNKNLKKLLLEYVLPFEFEVAPDFKNAQLNVTVFNRQELILRDPSYYQDDKTAQLLGIWEKQTATLLTMAGVEEEEAAGYAKAAVELDQRMAQVYNTAEYNAQVENNYHPVSVEEFANKSHNLDLTTLLKQTGLDKTALIIVGEQKYLDHFDDLFNENNFAALKGWLVGRFINDAANYLSHQFREAALPLTQAMFGIDALPSDQRFAYNRTKAMFDDVVGQYYGETYLGREAKADATAIVKNMIAVYEERLRANTWLSNITKEKAIKKLDTLVLKIGYPDKVQKFYDLFEVIPAEEGGTLYANVKANRRIKIEDNFSDLQHPVDRTKWVMSAVEPNACYDPQTNDITFPALILQKPFYSLDQDRAANYGGFGSVIGHEISHAFDNNGAQFDEAGNMKNWWSAEDFAAFNKRIKAEEDLFDGVEIGQAKLSGKLTVSENIGDQGGLTVAVEANRQEGGDSRTLFENYARVWETNAKPEFLQMLAATDVHALPQARTNVQVQCQDEFYQAFNVQPGDGMWLDPEKRVKVW